MQNVRFAVLLSMSFMVPLYGAAEKGKEIASVENLFLLVECQHGDDMTCVRVGRETSIQRLMHKIAVRKNVAANDIEIRANGYVLNPNSTIGAAVDVYGKCMKEIDLTKTISSWRFRKFDGE